VDTASAHVQSSSIEIEGPDRLSFPVAVMVSRFTQAARRTVQSCLVEATALIHTLTFFVETLRNHLSYLSGYLCRSCLLERRSACTMSKMSGQLNRRQTEYKTASKKPVAPVSILVFGFGRYRIARIRNVARTCEE
jgi:hypothetical protein